MPLPTIDFMEITPQFVKDQLFLILLLGDTIVTAFVNFLTGSNFKGVVGESLSFFLGSLINFATGSTVLMVVHTWQVLFIFFLLQSGLLKLMFDLLLARFAKH